MDPCTHAKLSLTLLGIGDLSIRHLVLSTHSEVLVGLAKTLLRKAKDSKQDPYLLFLEYRKTPLECSFSAAQLLMSRLTRSAVPITDKLLQPRTVDPKIVQKAYFCSKSLQKKTPL